MMTPQELMRQRRQMQQRIRDVLAQRRADAPVAVHQAATSQPADPPEPTNS